MNHEKPPGLRPSDVDACPTLRLAESEFVAIDRCSCGTLRLHLGALTLRISADGLAAIADTVGRALAVNARLQHPDAQREPQLLGKVRGQS